MEKDIEKDVSVLSGLFSYIITDLKGSTPIWEDFLLKTGKLHTQLKVTMSCLGAFVEALQRIADMATTAQGATRDVGKALTRLCLRHRAFETRLKSLIEALQDSLIIPMTDKIEDWKRITTQIDRTHSKEFKRARSELKKKNTDTLRLRKKVKRASSGAMGGGSELVQKCLNHAMQDIHDDYILLEETQKQAVRRALIEQRRRYCAFVGCMKPVMDEETHLLEEVGHLEEVMDSLCKLTANPERLPSASEQVIEDAKVGYNLMSESIYGYHSPPSSPGSSLGSRKSSMCSISSESNSTDLYGSQRGRSLSQPPPLQVSRLCSVSSQDSGFNSHDGGVRKTAQRLESLFQRQNSDEGASVANPIYDSRPTDTPPHLPRRNNSLPSNSLFDQSAASTPSGSQPSCRSEPQSPQMARAGFSVTQSTPDNESTKPVFLSRTPSHMSTLPVRGRDKSRKIPPVPPVRRTPPTSTLNVSLQLKQLDDTKYDSTIPSTSSTIPIRDTKDKSPELPLPSPPAELLSPSEENSIYGRMIKSCHATLERSQKHQEPTNYHEEHNAFLGGICSKINEKFGGDSTSNHNIYGTFGKGKKNPYRRSESQESEEQVKSEVHEPVKDKPVQKNSKIYKCASSDDIISGGANRWGAAEENLYEPINKELNESIYGGSPFGVTIAISTNDIYGSTSHQLAASVGRPSGAPPAPPERRTPQRRAQSFSNDLYGTIEDDPPPSSRSKVQQVKETFEHLGESLYGRISQSASTSRCTSPSRQNPFPNKLSMYQPQDQQSTSGVVHHPSQFSIYATKNEVLTPGVPVSIPKVPTDLSKKRFMQQLNEKLAQGTNTQASSIYGTIRNCNTATINKGRRCSSETRQNGQRIYGYIGAPEADVSPAASRVQEWLSGRPPVKDLGECKRSVLDQIRRGGKGATGGPPRL
ncbi:uncharacterized protein LOC100904857 [Galendromus occidentalis]|uniref:Uncharacterized protein LOC100904857 n=1 Tax=Galendromus occidentalis TaxID=34638 RepID=A0AAJ7WIL7_9ACAR|nr:uncharacterized protein LOC100904857 [Galendromus occidentalis]